MDIKEGDIRALKATVDNNDKGNMERDRGGGDCITALPYSQDENYLSMEELREALWWCLDIPLQDPP